MQNTQLQREKVEEKVGLYIPVVTNIVCLSSVLDFFFPLLLTEDFKVSLSAGLFDSLGKLRSLFPFFFSFFSFFEKDYLFKYSSEKRNTELFNAQNGVRKIITMTAMGVSLFSPKTSHGVP